MDRGEEGIVVRCGDGQVFNVKPRVTIDAAVVALYADSGGRQRFPTIGEFGEYYEFITSEYMRENYYHAHYARTCYAGEHAHQTRQTHRTYAA